MVTRLVEPKLTRAWDKMELKDQTMAAWQINVVHPLILRLDGYHVELKILKQKLMDDQANQAVRKFAVNDLMDRWKAFSYLLEVAAQGFEQCLQQHTREDTEQELLLKARQINLVTKKLSSATLSFDWPPSQLEFRDVVEKLRRSTQVLQAKAERIFTNMKRLVRYTLPRNLLWIRKGIEIAKTEYSAIEEGEVSMSEMNESRDYLWAMLNEWELRRRFFEGRDHRTRHGDV
ncbi:hypothetical protein QQZ08_002939 [Neonectria magnoliae]|uniref:Dynein heavy chain tail domain-containing protein n=1 Tax=Neonectria magnoliae TaxID=2732573 RepID=A0ABR1IAC7_9HYPO